MIMTDERKTNAILQAGVMAGMALKLDVEALAEVLTNPQPGFKYKETCQAAITFRATLENALGKEGVI